MNRFQIITVTLLVLLSALDGYDILAVAFASPAISASWGVGKAALGVVLSAGLAGMAVGSIFVTPLADVIGRKPILIAALCLMTAGMTMCALSASVGALTVWRVVTGIGIGACGALLYPIAAEFSAPERRPLLIAIMVVGFPIGGVMGGAMSALLLDLFSWHAVFVAGAAAAAILLPLIALVLPESPAFLLTRGTPGHIAEANRILARLGRPPAVVATGMMPLRRGYAALFGPDLWRTTLWITIVNALVVMASFFFLSWLPQMVADAGFSASTASIVSAIANLSGVLGGLIVGWRAQRGHLRELTVASLLAFGAATIVFGAVPPAMPVLVASAALTGFFLFGSTCGLYAVIAGSFSDEARASGAGFVTGIGRISSAAAPVIAGHLFAAGAERVEVGCVFGGAAIVAGALLALRRRAPAPAIVGAAG